MARSRIGLVASASLAVCVLVSSSLLAQDDFLQAPGMGVNQGAKAAPGGDVFDLNIEQLRRTPVAPALEEVVTSVSRQESTVGRSAAAIYVITQEMIHRSGAQTLADALRLAPGLMVAQRDANKWAISSRGFNQNLAKSLLVQIDGRIVYSPVFNGTYWDVQDMVLHDIERIEVIRGPGATLWGANAVNGIVNIITKSSKKTCGVYYKGGGGTEQDGFSTMRVGGCKGDMSYRVYGKWFERGPDIAVGGPSYDRWRQKRAGFRTDWTPNCYDTVTVQGDVYTGVSGTTALGDTPDPSQVDGHNVLTRWTRKFDDDTDFSFLVYYDENDRTNELALQHVETFDFDFQHHFQLNEYNNVIWGLRYRRVKDFLPGFTPAFRFIPTGAVKSYYSAFLQDEITLREDSLYLTVGTKLSKNDFTGFEIQPTIRMLYLPSDREVLWASVSRAVRIPSRLEQDSITVAFTGAGPSIIGLSPGIGSEELIAYELGYRAQPSEQFDWDLALFYNTYEDLDSFRATGFVFPFTLLTRTNGGRGSGAGLEIVGHYQVHDNWKLTAWYSLLALNLMEVPSPAPVAPRVEGSSPRNQAFLMSSWNLRRNLELDLMARYVDWLPAQSVPSYVSADIRLAWRPRRNFEFSLVGQNLLASRHLEFGNRGGGRPDPLVEIPMGVFGMITAGY